MAYTQFKIVGNGSFGVVFQTKLSPSGEDAAIKRVLQDKRFKVQPCGSTFLPGRVLVDSPSSLPWMPVLTFEGVFGILRRIGSCRSCASSGTRTW